MTTPPLTITTLRTMSHAQLEQLYQQGTAHQLPTGDTEGYIISRPHTLFAAWTRLGMALAQWHGKLFLPTSDPSHTILYNKITPFRIKAEKARVYIAESWFDHQPSIIVDYSTTGLISRWIRDEIRQISPTLYLGLAYRRKNKQPWLYFALEHIHQN